MSTYGDDERSDGKRPADEHDDANDEQGSHEKRDRARQILQRPGVRIALVVAGVAVVLAGIAFWVHARRYESTDDAFVDARIVRLAPQITGRVAHVYANDNQLVHTGDVLVEIDPGDVGARLAQVEAQRALANTEVDQARTGIRSAEAQLAQAQAMVTSAAAQAHNAELELKRYRSLQESNPRAVAQSQLDLQTASARSAAAQVDAARQQSLNAAAAVDVARTQAKSAEARIKVLDAQVQEARLNFGYAKVVAPVDGHVAQRRVTVGSYVSPGQQMLAVVPLELWVTANLKETQLAEVKAGQSVQLDIDACPDADVEGHVDSIQRGAGQAFAVLPPENATGNFVKVVQRVPVKIVFDRVSAECALGPGMSVVPNIRVR